MLGRISRFAPLAFLLPAPAMAQTASLALPEPSGLALLALGLAGVAIGRSLSRQPPQD